MVYLWLDPGFHGVSRKISPDIPQMDFMLWAVRTMHLFSVVLWLGGLLYQTVILHPLLGTEGFEKTLGVLQQLRSFLPFTWMSLTTLLVTGVGLMLFSPRFLILEYPDWWSVALGLKQVAFLIIAFVSFGSTRMLTRAISTLDGSGWSEQGARFSMRVVHLNRTNVFLGIGALLLAASMR